MHAALGFLALGCGPEASTESSETSPSPTEIVLVPRVPHLATYPCGEQCHDAREPDAAPRALALFHAGREAAHGPAVRWCDDCHSIEDPERLRLLGGDLVSFDDSDRVCGQCHGEKHRDWRNGIHGLSTGGWQGTVWRRTCTACHDPHTRGSIWLEALPAPERDPRVNEPVRPRGRRR